MRNTIKILAKLSRWICVIAIVALIGFSFAACEEEDNGGGGGGGTGVTYTFDNIPAF